METTLYLAQLLQQAVAVVALILTNPLTMLANLGAVAVAGEVEILVVERVGLGQQIRALLAEPERQIFLLLTVLEEVVALVRLELLEQVA
jgi:hypothetical protein